MALLFMEGFDWSSDASVLTRRWDNAGVDGLSAGRSGGNAVFMDRITAGATGGYLWKTVPSSGDTLIVGAAIYVESGFGGLASNMIGIGEGQNVHCGIALNASGYIVFSVANVPIFTSSQQMPAQQWRYLELEAKIHNTEGYAIVRYDGVEVINLTNIDTRNGGSGIANSIFMHVQWGLFNYDAFRADDIYVCDKSGLVNNSFLGDVAVKILRPVADSTPLTWTPSSGTSHFEMVNDILYSEIDYITGTGIIGDRDTFTLQDLTNNPNNICGIAITTIADKTDSGDSKLKHFVSTNGVEYISPAYPLPYASTSTILSNILETDPSTGELWTKDGVNNSIIGVEVA